MGWMALDNGFDSTIRKYMGHEAMDSQGSLWVRQLESQHKRDPRNCSLIAMDLDGTLLRPDGSIPSWAPSLLQDLGSVGVPTILTSARPVRSVLMIQEELGLTGPIVAFNGAWVGTRDSCSFREPIPVETVGRILELLEIDSRLQWSIFSEDKWYTRDLNSQPAKYETAQLGFAPDGSSDARAAEKLLVVCPDWYSGELRQSIGSMRLPVSMSCSKPGYVEIVSQGVSKLAALERILPSLGRQLGDVLAIGDGENDVELIRASGHGVAMGEGSTALCAVADTIVTGQRVHSPFLILAEMYRAKLNGQDPGSSQGDKVAKGMG